MSFILLCLCRNALKTNCYLFFEFFPYKQDTSKVIQIQICLMSKALVMLSLLPCCSYFSNFIYIQSRFYYYTMLFLDKANPRRLCITLVLFRDNRFAEGCPSYTSQCCFKHVSGLPPSSLSCCINDT